MLGIYFQSNFALLFPETMQDIRRQFSDTPPVAHSIHSLSPESTEHTQAELNLPPLQSPQRPLLEDRLSQLQNYLHSLAAPKLSELFNSTFETDQ